MSGILSEISFSTDDITFLQDKEFFIRKHRLMTDMYGLLSEVRNVFERELSQQWKVILQSEKLGKGKISKGENYQLLPYLVLDYPAIFSQHTGIFTIRTMFWWGNGFSITLHINGLQLQNYKEVLIKNLEKIRVLDGYFGINSDQWQHHYDETNYCKVQELNKEILQDSLNRGFVKLSLRLPVNEYDSLEAWSLESAKKLMSLFN